MTQPLSKLPPQVEAMFKGRLCPIMSVASLMPRESKLVQGVGPHQYKQSHEPSAAGCQGPGCMWFRIGTDETGKPVTGDCAVGIIANSLVGGVNLAGQAFAATLQEEVSDGRDNGGSQEPPKET